MLLLLSLTRALTHTTIKKLLKLVPKYTRKGKTMNWFEIVHIGFGNAYCLYSNDYSFIDY